MDVRYRVSGSGSAALASSPLPSDSMVLRSESDIFATRARGSCDVDPGPERLRTVTLSALSMGNWLFNVRKRLVFVKSLIFSNFAIQRFTVSAV